jgi:hypothetical protein
VAERTVALATVASAVAAFHALVLPAIREALPFRGLGLMALEAATLLAALGGYGPLRAALRRAGSPAPGSMAAAGGPSRPLGGA